MDSSPLASAMMNPAPNVRQQGDQLDQELNVELRIDGSGLLDGPVPEQRLPGTLTSHVAMLCRIVLAWTSSGRLTAKT
jgi:hypothetical protein